jgi:uncharacterized membrane protein
MMGSDGFRQIFGGIEMNRAELKSLAKQQIKGKIGTLFLVALVIALITGALSMIPTVGSIASMVITPAFTLATVAIYLKLAKGESVAVGDAFSKFDQFWPAFKVNFLVGLFTALWSLLFYIPGIIKGLSYSQANYILAENPGIGAREAINRSKAMMDGHKMELFVLNLSFIGWYLLCGITFGIAAIWVIPYVNATMTNFYNTVKSGVTVEG